MKRSLFSTLLLSALLINVHVFAAKQPAHHRSTDTIFKLANIFQSNMVIQQDKPFTIWGKAMAGESVTIKPDWSGEAVAVVAGSDNTWRTAVKVPKAIPGYFKPHTLTISIKDTAVTLSNLLIGDLWL